MTFDELNSIALLFFKVALAAAKSSFLLSSFKSCFTTGDDDNDDEYDSSLIFTEPIALSKCLIRIPSACYQLFCWLLQDPCQNRPKKPPTREDHGLT